MISGSALVETQLIETQALADWNLADLRIIETAQNRESFDAGHIPGSIFWPLSELLMPDFQLRTDASHFGELLSRSGITPETWVVCSFNGDASMAAWAPWLFWILTNFGHEKTVVLNGGTVKWRAENRPLTRLEIAPELALYPTPDTFQEAERATLSTVQNAVNSGRAALLDARSAREFVGEHFFDAPPQNGQRAGHIPGAIHLPHSQFLQDDGTFRPLEELQLICDELGLNPESEIIAYCAVGIRAALLWFVLKYRLGFSNVRNYDGSWNQWNQAEAEFLAAELQRKA